MVRPLPVFAAILAVGGLAVSLAVSLAASDAAALDLPARKPGLWEMSMIFEGRQLPPMVSQHCIDAETDKMMNAMGSQMSKDMCEQKDIRQVGTTLVVDSVCKFGGGTSTSHSVMSGDFNSAYTVDVETKREGGSAMMGPSGPGGVSKMHIASKWLGPCKAGQRPGDMSLPNGMTVNIRDMQNGGATAPPAMKRQ